MSKDNEAVDLLREWEGEEDRPWELIKRTQAFLAKHDIVKCHCGGETLHRSWKGDNRILCDRCGHAGKSSRTQEGAIKNWTFTQEAIREKRRRDLPVGLKCSECGK